MMQDWLAARARITPDKIALRIGEDQYTFRQLDESVHTLCANLRVVGVQPRQIIGILATNTIVYVQLVFALMRLNAILLPLNTRLTPDELNWQLDHTGCRLILCTEATAATATHLANDERRVYIHASQSLYDNLRLMFSVKTLDFSPPQIGQIILEDTAVIMFTSGTTGKPKGVMLTYGNFFYSAMSSAYHSGVLPEDRWLCVLPLYHVGGLSILYRACLYGSSVDLHEKFDVERVNHALTHEPITMVSLVPTMLYRLLEARTGAWHPALRCILLGGAAASWELLNRARTEKIPIATTYGLTEATSQVATEILSPGFLAMTPPLNPLPIPQGGDLTPLSIHGEGQGGEGLNGYHVGKPLMFTSVRIVDENGNNLPVYHTGEIVVSGATVMQGYYNQPEATAKVLRDGELFTGDMGYINADGDLFVLQRRSDLILSGGENVYPAEVEAVLRQHPGVQEACVVGIPDAEWGQRVVAAVVRKPGAEVAENDLITFARERLAGYKQPRRILFVPELPQTASGKIQRVAVAAMFQ